MKLLLYCCKNPHKLFATNEGYVLSDFELGEHYKIKEKLNGKIVAECDFEVEEIVCDGYAYLPLNSNPAELETKGCLTEQELENYFTKKYGLVGYAIHIKNLHIFDEPKELSDYYSDLQRWVEIKAPTIKKAPQNMCYAFDDDLQDYILISIKPQWLCKILNGEKTIEVRKKVLKGMLE